MLKFESNNYTELERELEEKSTELSILTLKSICKAIDENIDVVSLGVFVNLKSDIIVKREGYLRALELNIDKVAKAEEFELCATAMKYIDILKIERSTDA